ncbi:hypothetical protein Scep_028374 [Stephania cephalantha]|uniref:Choline transporter-like protein n=1 Tax=Stephania cephalantha TaxID=152367 RepID=A0AAP0HLR7_9MAGN
MRGGPLGAVIGRYPSSNGDSQMGNSGGGIIRGNRKCRDVVFLIVFIAFWVAMIVNSSFGFNQGNPLRLTYGVDYKGNVCGSKHSKRDLRELQIKYWMNPNQVYESGQKNSQFKLADARSICLMECPFPSEDGLNWVCDYPDGAIHISMDEWIDRNYDFFEFLTPEMRNSSLQLQGPCYPVIFPSVNVHWSCQFIARVSNVSLRHWQQMGGANINEDIIIDKSIHKSLNSRSVVLQRYVADIGKSWPVLIVCGGMMHIVSVVGANTDSLMVFGWQLDGLEQSHLRAVTILMTAVMIISVLSSLAIIRRILMATSVAAKVIGEVQALIIFPIIPYAILAVFFMFWFSATLHLFSAGQILQNDCKSNCCAYDLGADRISCDKCCGYSIHYTPHIAIAILFHLFGCYWATQFFIASSSTVIAGSVASYYWARGGIQQDIPFLPVFSSMKRLMRYNLGSVALGSLIVSPFESVRYILESVRRKLKGSNITSRPSECCLGCIGWTVKSINRNAYIMIAITGKSFCKASEIATGLIMNNILRIGKVNVIGDVILFLGKLCVSLFSAVFAFLMLDTHKYRSAHNKISSPLFPVLICKPCINLHLPLQQRNVKIAAMMKSYSCPVQVCWWLGYIVATLFFAVVEMSIDTIILSFCQDSEEHQGTAQYAPPLLMETLDDQNEMQRLTHGSS